MARGPKKILCSIHCQKELYDRVKFVVQQRMFDDPTSPYRTATMGEKKFDLRFVRLTNTVNHDVTVMLTVPDVDTKLGEQIQSALLNDEELDFKRQEITVCVARADVI